jgi:hypothetical protein
VVLAGVDYIVVRLVAFEHEPLYYTPVPTADIFLRGIYSLSPMPKRQGLVALF